MKTKQEEQGLMIRDAANTIVVSNQMTYDNAAEFLLNVKTKMKEVEAAMNPQCKAAHAAWQTALAQKKQYLKPFEEAEAIVKKAIGVYVIEQRRIAEEAQRIADEAQRIAEEKERQKLLKKAAKAEAKGNDDVADDLRADAAAVHIPVAVATTEIAKAAGVSTSNSYDIEVVDLKELCRAIGGDEIQINPDTLFTVKLGTLKTYLKLTRKKAIPGCRVTPTVNVSGKVGA